MDFFAYTYFETVSCLPPSKYFDYVFEKEQHHKSQFSHFIKNAERIQKLFANKRNYSYNNERILNKSNKKK